jgi:hypothetical protein
LVGPPYPDLARTRKWRNWQTHQLEGLAVAIPWGFESPLPHFTRSRSFNASGRIQALGHRASRSAFGHESPLPHQLQIQPVTSKSDGSTEAPARVPLLSSCEWCAKPAGLTLPTHPLSRSCRVVLMPDSCRPIGCEQEAAGLSPSGLRPRPCPLRSREQLDSSGALELPADHFQTHPPELLDGRCQSPILGSRH